MKYTILILLFLLNGNTPVPGYSTVFPFYTRPQYALPGERLTPP